MGRFRPSGSYGHRISKTSYASEYRISWTVDRYYEGNRLRFPRGWSRVTDLAGAKRFAKRWGVELPA